MARKIRPAQPRDLEELQIAIAMVKAAKQHFKSLGARSTVLRLGKALSSAAGAERHMHHRILRTSLGD